MNKGLDELTPKEIVVELDKYIIGQKKAKKTLAIAIRNRSRRKKLDETMRKEVSPKNIILIGSTGVGKTEIARRISRLANAPFIKIEATKYTEVGYVGRDVESMIRDLMQVSVQQVKAELAKEIEEKVDKIVRRKLLELLLPATKQDQDSKDTMNMIKNMLDEKKLEDKEIEIKVKPRKVSMNFVGGTEIDLGGVMNIGSMFSNNDRKARKVTIAKAREILKEEENEKLLDDDKVIDIAKERCQEMGIIFIDEIDKIAMRSNNSSGQVSREGVQRDILPIIEGTTVNTKYGMIDTTHILFIGSGAFHLSKPSDLIPELQGRFPLRVELDNLSADDFYKILIEPKNALTKQYIALLATEDVTLSFDNEALREIANIAATVNSNTENIGARRLHTILEQLLEELSYTADELKGQEIKITKAYVNEKLSDIVKDQDLSRYIL